MDRINEDYLVSAEYQILKLFVDTPTMLDSPFDPDILLHKTARVVYDAIRKLHEAKESITEQSLLRVAGELDDRITAVTIRSIFMVQADLSNFIPAVKTLERGSIKHRINTKLTELQALTETVEDVDQSKLDAILYDMQTISRSAGQQKKAKTIEHLLDTYIQELRNRQVGKYYHFNDMFLDATLTRKASPGQVIVIGAATGAGKSTYGLNLINGLVNMNRPCMYFSLEMDEIATMDRWLALRLGIPVEEFYGDSATLEKIISKIETEKTILSNKPFKFIDDPDISLDNLVHLIQEFKSEYRQEYVCVFIDLVTMVKEFSMTGSGGTLANQIEFSVNRLNAIAKRENICVVAIVQMNRETDKEKVDDIEDIPKKYRPTLSQIKNSNALGERARVVLSVFRKKYYAERLFPDDPTVAADPDVLEVQLLKQSQGAVGKIGYYMFDGPSFSVKPIELVEG